MAIQATNDFASVLEQGRGAQQSGNTELAYTFFARATELDPNSGDAWYGRAGTAGDPDDALVSLGYATALQPNNPELPPQLDLYAQMRASVVGPSDAPTLVLDGQKLAEVGLTSQAEYLFRRAKELDDNMEDASVWLAAVTQDPAESDRLLKKVLAQNPDNPLARAGLGDSMLTPDLGRKDGAAATAEAATGDIFAAEPWRAIFETTTETPAEATVEPAVPEDLASQPWWGEPSQSTAETLTPPASSQIPDNLASQSWWGEPSQSTAESLEPSATSTVPDDLASQSWWTGISQPTEAEPAEANAERKVPDEFAAPMWSDTSTEPEAAATEEQPVEAAAAEAGQAQPLEPAVEGENWWDAVTEANQEVTPVASAQHPAELAAVLVRQGQEALAVDDKPVAYAYFSSAIELTDDNEAAWLGRARATDDSAERMECLERVLLINPNNMPAREALTLSRVRKLRDEGRRIPGARERKRIEPRPEEESAPAAEEMESPEPAAAAIQTEPVAAETAPVDHQAQVQAPEPEPREKELVAPESRVDVQPQVHQPEPEPMTARQEQPVPDDKSPAVAAKLPIPANVAQKAPVQTGLRAASAGPNLTPWIVAGIALIALILIVLAALYMLRL